MDMQDTIYCQPAVIKISFTIPSQIIFPKTIQKPFFCKWILLSLCNSCRNFNVFHLSQYYVHLTFFLIGVKKRTTRVSYWLNVSVSRKKFKRFRIFFFSFQSDLFQLFLRNSSNTRKRTENASRFLMLEDFWITVKSEVEYLNKLLKLIN